MSLLTALRADLEELLRVSGSRTLLWLDPERRWERLLDRLGDQFELLK